MAEVTGPAFYFFWRRGALVTPALRVASSSETDRVVVSAMRPIFPTTAQLS